MIIHDHPQRSPEWFAARCGIPTASRFDALLAPRKLLKNEIVKRIADACVTEEDISKKKVAELEEIAHLYEVDISFEWEGKASATDYVYELASEVIAEGPVDEWKGNEDTEHGVEAEQDAIDAYEFITGNRIDAIGFVTDYERTFGASPDGIIGEDGIAEIKSFMLKNIIRTIIELKRDGFPKRQYLQIQGQLMATERQWCDLILFHSKITPIIIRVWADTDVQKKLKEQIDIINERRDAVVKEFTEYSVSAQILEETSA